jgi:hypothetical protein
MPRRIDIDGGDPQHEIEEALRQLTERQRAPQPEEDLERAIQEVGEQQKEVVVTRRRKADRPLLPRIAWIGFAIVALGLLLTVVFVFARQEPPPPAATNAEDAVRLFWTCLIEEKYEAATSYWPQLQTRYGSAAQAGAQLRDNLRSNPPANIRSVGPAEVTPDGQYRVPYEVYMRSGQPRTGELTVSNIGPTTGFVITAGGV